MLVCKTVVETKWFLQTFGQIPCVNAHRIIKFIKWWYYSILKVHFILYTEWMEIRSDAHFASEIAQETSKTWRKHEKPRIFAKTHPPPHIGISGYESRISLLFPTWPSRQGSSIPVY